MREINKGDMPAFPRYGENLHSNDGMTLRQWYAGQALIGLVSRAPIYPDHDAETAFKLADAMLEAEK